MSDLGTFVISIIGFVLSMIYIVIIEFRKPGLFEYHFNENQNIEIDVLLKDYESTNNEIERRENITLVVGTILVAAAFLIVSETFSEILIKSNGNETHLVDALASIFLYSIWLFGVHYTTKRLDDIAYARIRGIEEKITKMSSYQRDSTFGIHTFLKSYIERHKTRFLIWFRRRFWGWILVFLSLYWLWISDYVSLLWMIIIIVVVVVASSIIYAMFFRPEKKKTHRKREMNIVKI